MTTPSALRRLGNDSRGQDLIEYAVVAAFVSLMAVVCAIALNSAMGSLYGTAGRTVKRGADFATSSSATTRDCSKDNDTSAAATSPRSTCK